jgi:hypothetical protein
MEELLNISGGRGKLRLRLFCGWATRARFGLLAAVGISLLSFYPQLQLWTARGDLSDAVAYNQGLGDEVAYASYLNALIEGKPRRGDPYTGRYHSAQNPQPESLFSIQFIPPFVLAIPARLLGVSASTVFIILTPIVALGSSLILLLLLQTVTKNEHLAAAGVVVVFCLGALVAGEGAIANWTTGEAHFDFLPFLRRYQPAAAFPFFLLLCLLSWKALTTEKNKRKYSVAVGALLTMLIYSYFYLWTAAAAWLVTLSVFWWTLRREDRANVGQFLGLVFGIASVASIPYVFLIFRGAEAMTSINSLVLSRRPDFLSTGSVLSALLLLVVATSALRGRLDVRDSRFIFAVSFAVLPFVVLNQQVITGRVMQPIHYKGFVNNYSLLIAIVLVAGLTWRKQSGEPWRLSKRALFWIALAAFDWGFIETRHAVARGFVANDKAAEEMSVYARLKQVQGHQRDTDQSVVLFSDLRMADGAPVASLLPVMWAPHMVVYPGASPLESKERLYRHLYYTGVSARDLEDYLFGRKVYYGCAVGLFGFDRFIDGLNPNAAPISQEEKLNELAAYQRYMKTFDLQRAKSPRLSFFVVPMEERHDLSNLDRWYDRNSVEHVGKFLVYRLTLKEQELNIAEHTLISEPQSNFPHDSVRMTDQRP